MPSHTITLRVRYADTDQMGIVYYAKYLEYFEVARTEMLRSMGLPYREIEEKGFALPVASASIKYYKGALYDDELHVTATISPSDSPKIDILYSIKRGSEVIAEGETKLVFVDKLSGRPVRAPQFYLDAITK
ncbi:MAG: thioesterase family protein [Bacteroidota bacterium]|nr:thioesterase family protein [Bacteroidota bacterium]MDP4228902.1 thioesterase family protein [Bacteroidota bacterium]MDP4237474.1 thioesterase family protein [Bacteroidota bacterium]